MNTEALMKAELEQLIGLQDKSVGIDLKRTNYKIAELSNRIDRMKE